MPTVTTTQQLIDLVRKSTLVDDESTKSDRGALAGQIPAGLLGLYDKIRTDHGGIGAAEFAGDVCGGCRLELPPADLAAVKAAPVDEVLRCEECRRILVRTALISG